MTGVKLTQIGMALCLMASLLIGSGSACTCSHIEVANDLANDCLSHHESAGNVDSAETGNGFDYRCVCVVNQRVPYAASKYIGRELRDVDRVLNSQPVAPDLQLVAVTIFDLSSSEFADDISYSNTLTSLLPSRAPPRL